MASWLEVPGADGGKDGAGGGDVHSTGEHRGDQVLGETGREPHLANQRQRQRHPQFGADECQDQCYSKSKLLKVSRTTYHISPHYLESNIPGIGSG